MSACSPASSAARVSALVEIGVADGGHAVTLFEKNDRIGGLLRYGIPNFKMEKHLIDRRVEQMKAKGVTITVMPDSERARWAKTMPNIAKEWAADLDKKGLPGSKVLAAYMAEVRASGKVIRDWEKD